MAKRRPIPLRKQRTREHVLADLSVNHVERFVLRCGHTVERLIHDYGLDLMLCTFDDQGERENGELFLQLKAVERVRTRKQAATFPFRVALSDLHSWLDEPMPVILIVYDAEADLAWWLYVQSYFEARPRLRIDWARKTITIHFSKQHVVDEAAIRKFAGFKANVVRQIKGVFRHDE